MLTGLYMTETVTRIRDGAPTQDAYGNDVPGSPTSLDVEGCSVLPPGGQEAASTEATDARDQVVILRVLLAPAGTDLRATDRVHHGADEYEVHGRPSEYPGALAHVAAQLKAVTG